MPGSGMICAGGEAWPPVAPNPNGRSGGCAWTGVSPTFITDAENAASELDEIMARIISPIG